MAADCQKVFDRRQVIARLAQRINRRGPPRSARHEMLDAWDWLDERDKEELIRVSGEASSGFGLSADGLDQDALPDSAKQHFRITPLQRMAENESRISGLALQEQIEGFKQGYEAGFNRAIDILKQDHWHSGVWKILEDKTK